MKTLTYGILAIPLAFLGLPLYIYLPTFYVSEVGVNVALVGLVLFISRALDMFADPFIGRVSDKYIKKRYLIFIGSIILLFGFYFLTHPNENSNAIYLLLFSTLTYIGWSLISIPYLSLNAKLGEDYHHNTKLSFSREVCTILGVLIALLLPYIFKVSQDPQQSLTIIWQTIIVVLPLTLSLFLFVIKEPIKEEKINPFINSIKKFYKDL